MTDVTYSKLITPEFVMECAKIGKVHLSSHQVTITSDDGYINLERLDLPESCRVQFVSAKRADDYKASASVTFIFPTRS